VIELKERRKEKRARRKQTRPEPTIYGNCDSWSFIVGKKPRTYSPENRKNKVVAVQQHRIYTQLINRFEGQLFGQLVGDLWIGCARWIHPTWWIREPCDMPFLNEAPDSIQNCRIQQNS
jgi:hypothetical protein